MAFVPEDGTGLPDANSYVSVEDADEYFELAPGNWVGEDSDKQRWLVSATSYIDTAFRAGLLCYSKLSEDQALIFPTKEMGEGLPVELIKACCEYAVRAKAGPLMPDPVVDATGFAVVTTRKKVGPIEKEFSVAGGQQTAMLWRSYPYPDSLMRGLLCAGYGGTRVIR
jgi:hypothetical protein